MVSGRVDVSEWFQEDEAPQKGRKQMADVDSYEEAGDPEKAQRAKEEKLEKEQLKVDKKQVATGILLADAIKKMLKQSKIASTFLDHLSKAIGLLVDLILLPFLPLLIVALITLYTAIINFGKWWNEHTPKTPEPNAGVIDWAKYLAQLDVFLIDVFSKIVNPFWLLSDWIANTLVGLIKAPLINLAIDIANTFINAWNTWVQFVYDIKAKILEIWPAILAGVSSLWDSIKDAVATKLAAIGDVVYDAMKSVYDKIVELVLPFIRDPVGTLSKLITGDTTNNNNTNTFNFNGTVGGLEKTVMDFLRQNGSRYGL
jgi:hypothetical protein